jgi:hypothetical protein
MKRIPILAVAMLLLAETVLAKEPARQVPPFPGTLVNATYIYVTSYDGDQFNPNLLPEDRAAISAVQDALQKWGRFTLVYKPQEAEIVLMVQSRPTEDVLAVYDAQGWPQNNFLWRVMAQSGLQKNETPLVTDLRSAFEKAAGQKK